MPLHRCTGKANVREPILISDQCYISELTLQKRAEKDFCDEISHRQRSVYVSHFQVILADLDWLEQGTI